MTQTDSHIAKGADWKSRALLSVSEVSALTGLGRATIFRLMAAGSLASVRVGKRRGIWPSALEDMLRQGEEGVVETGQ